MTIQEMHDEMDIKLDKEDNAWFNDTEKDKWLNEAIVKYVKENKVNFESSERVRTALAAVVRTVQIPMSTNQLDLQATIPTWAYTLAVQAVWENSCYPGGIKRRPVPPIQIDDEATMDIDPFNVPNDDYPKYVEESTTGGDTLVFTIKSDTVPNSLIVKFIKIPTKVSLVNNVDCELHEIVHDEIVDEAVKLAMIPIRDEMYPIQAQETKENS